MSDPLNEFIFAQHQQNLKTTDSLARIEQMQRDTVQRLFGGDGQPGVLPFMSDAAKTCAKEEGERAAKIEQRVSLLEAFKTGTLRWIAGVIAVLTFEGTAVALYLHTIAGKITIK